jgi:hypothetical protein
MRWLPMVSMTEVKGTMPQADPHRAMEDAGEHAPPPITKEEREPAGSQGLAAEVAQ